jgi:hypothetical protein
MKLKLTEQDFIDAASKLKCEVAAIKAVCAVEAPKGGFLPDDQVTILFERHKFYQFTKGKFFKTNPDICNPKAGGYGAAGQNQHNRLTRAVALDKTSALLSCSWGKFQIMGFNYKLAGFTTLQAFLNAMSTSEGEQLKAFVNFVIAASLDDELRRKDWSGFARSYNGESYKINNYDTNIEHAYKTLT